MSIIYYFSIRKKFAIFTIYGSGSIKFYMYSSRLTKYPAKQYACFWVREKEMHNSAYVLR